MYARTAADRLFNLVKLNTAQALAGHIPMEDTSPLFLKDYSCKPHLNYLSQGQIQAQGRFGILQPQSHFENRATGSKLMKTNIPREIIERRLSWIADRRSRMCSHTQYPARKAQKNLTDT